jgi:hypothetical protein
METNANLDAITWTTDDAVYALDFAGVDELERFARDHSIAPRGPDRWPVALLAQARIREIRSPRATTGELALHLGLSEARINQLVRAEVISRPAGGHDLHRARREYLDQGPRTAPLGLPSRFRQP